MECRIILFWNSGRPVAPQCTCTKGMRRRMIALGLAQRQIKLHIFLLLHNHWMSGWISYLLRSRNFLLLCYYTIGKYPPHQSQTGDSPFLWWTTRGSFGDPTCAGPLTHQCIFVFGNYICCLSNQCLVSSSDTFYINSLEYLLFLVCRIQSYPDNVGFVW